MPPRAAPVTPPVPIFPEEPHFDQSIDQFTFRPASPWLGVDGERLLAIAGEAGADFKRRLIELLKVRGKLESGGFDMEPFEVLRDIIRQAFEPSIGGPPQLLKVYRHMNVTPFTVYWPDGASGKRTILGRTLLPYEVPPTGVLDPDSLVIA